MGEIFQNQNFITTIILNYVLIIKDITLKLCLIWQGLFGLYVLRTKHVFSST
jgi:hypothetical protein